METNKDLNNPTALYIEARKDGKYPIVNPGSGFFVEEDLIVTNIHVVAGATSISAKVLDADIAHAVEGVAAFDAENDLVILKVASKGTPLPVGDNDAVQSGDCIRVVGCPDRKYKTTKGTIHSIRSSDKWLRMKVETIKGNSGGPVLNCKNEVVGIHSSKSRFCGYAIPSKVLRNLLIQLKSKEPMDFKQWNDTKVSKAYFYYIQAERKPNEIAVTYLDKAIELYPDYTQFYINRGRVKCNLDQPKTEVEAQSYYKEAIDDYTEALQISGESAEVYKDRGFARCLLGQSEVEQKNVAKAQQYYKEAIKDHTDAIRLCSNYTPAYDCRADVRYFLGKSEEDQKNEAKSQDLYELALSDMNVAIEQSPCCAEFYYKRAEIKVTLCDLRGAIDDYCSTLRLDWNHVKARCSLDLAKKCLSQNEV